MYFWKQMEWLDQTARPFAKVQESVKCGSSKDSFLRASWTATGPPVGLIWERPSPREVSETRGVLQASSDLHCLGCWHSHQWSTLNPCPSQTVGPKELTIVGRGGRDVPNSTRLLGKRLSMVEEISSCNLERPLISGWALSWRQKFHFAKETSEALLSFYWDTWLAQGTIGTWKYSTEWRPFRILVSKKAQ